PTCVELDDLRRPERTRSIRWSIRTAWESPGELRLEDPQLPPPYFPSPVRRCSFISPGLCLCHCSLRGRYTHKTANSLPPSVFEGQAQCTATASPRVSA